MKKLLVLLLFTLFLLLIPSLASAQSVRYQGQAISPRGLPFSNQNVAVCTQPASTGTQPCSPLATLATSTSTTSGGANPTTTDQNGNYFFYAAPGHYTVQIYGPQISSPFVQPDTVLACDPTGACTHSGTETFKTLNSIRFANQFAGADLGAQINAADADLGATAGEIWVTAPGTIATAVSLANNHKLKLWAGIYLLNVNGCNFTLGAGSGLQGSGFVVVSSQKTGTTLRANTAGAIGVCFTSTAAYTHLSDFGFDGQARSIAVGAGLSFGIGSFHIDTDNVSFWDWAGTTILISGSGAQPPQDLHFHEIHYFNSGNTTGSLPCVDIQGAANGPNSLQFSNNVFDQCYFIGLRQGSAAGANVFSNMKFDADAAPSGAVAVNYTGAALRDSWSNVIIRADQNAVGDCFHIDGAVTDLKIANLTCDSLVAPGASNAGVNVNNASAKNIEVSNAYFNGFNVAMRDISASYSNSYLNVSVGTNTLTTSFTNPQTVLQAGPPGSLAVATNIRGTNTNNNAGAGAIGEYVSSTIASGSAVALTTATTANITSISLTAGDWDITGACDYTFAATTSFTNLTCGISTTSATLGGQDSAFSFETPAEVPTAALPMTWPVPTVRLSLAPASTTVFLVTQGTFTVSTLSAYGTIRARRVR